MPEEPVHISHLSIKIEGTPAAEEVVSDLLEVVVDRTLHLPSMFTIRLFSPNMRWLTDDTFREGKNIEISIGDRPSVKVLSGKIAGLEPELDQENPTLVVRGYDLAHKLHRGRHRRSFQQVTDSDLATRLAGESGLTPGTIDSTSEVHEYVFQNNQTNAEFLLERARRHGFELFVEDNALHFRRPSPSGAPVRLVWGEDLHSFRPRMSTAEQVNEVEVRGWDPKRKREVVGRATRGQGAPEIGLSQGGGGADIARRTWGEAKVGVVDQFVRSPSEAEALAQAVLDEAASIFVEAEGTCTANPDIVPGRQVQIDNVGSRFNGTYYVTQVIHEWSSQGLVTRFMVSGRRDRGVWSLLENASSRNFGLGMVIGVVTNNKDPENMGRVKVKYPWLSDQDESAWARIAAPMGGNERGFFYLPEVDDEVLIGFEHGDIHRPFVMGTLWNGRDKPPLTASQAVGGDGKVNKRVLKSRSGHTVTLDDTAGGEEITIVDKTGNNKIVFHSPDNSMQISVQGDLTIESQGKITLKAMSGVDMSSQTDFTIKGQSGVDVSSQAQIKLSGQAGAELSSSVQTAIKGTTVDINGTGPVSVSGTPIRLN